MITVMELVHINARVDGEWTSWPDETHVFGAYPAGWHLRLLLAGELDGVQDAQFVFWLASGDEPLHEWLAAWSDGAAEDHDKIRSFIFAREPGMSVLGVGRNARIEALVS